MKAIGFFTFFLLALAFQSTAQSCLSGNCSSGFGKFKYDNGDIYDAEGNGPKPGPDCVVVSWEKQEAAVPDPNKGPQSGDRVWGQRYNENEVEDWPIIDEVTPGPGPAYLVSLTEWKHCIWVEWDGKWWKEVVPL